jgi:hypothetical protein
MGVPDEVRRHLRRMESEARALHAHVRSVLRSNWPGEDEEGGGDPHLRAAMNDLAAVLEDERRSPLLRALRRRPDQLREGEAGRRSLDDAWAGVRRRAERALARHDAAAEFQRAYRRVRLRFGARLRWHLADALSRWGIAEEDAERRADALSLWARIDRLGEIEAELAEAEALLPESVAEPLEVSAWPEDVALEELEAAVRAAEGTAHEHAGLAWRARGRRLAEAHAERLLGNGASRPAAGRLEGAAREAVLRAGERIGVGDEDVDAWGILLRAAARSRTAAPGPDSPTALADGEDASGSILFVVPLFGPFVLVRTGRPWPVRVHGRGVRVGAPADCVAAHPPGATETTLPLDAWAPPLFELPPEAPAGWLATRAAAVVVPFARIAPDRWLARVEKRGRLEAMDDPPPTQAKRGRDPAVRVLSAAMQVPARGELAAGPAEGVTKGPFGWRTAVVPLPLADVRRGWMRTAELPAGADHARAEQVFFQVAGRRVPGCTVRCLGHDPRTRGYLYAPPLALPVHESPQLRAWAESDPLAFAAAAARLWRALGGVGLALGFYHASTLAFRARFGAASEAQALHAVATAAPLGTALGRAYRRSRETVPLFPAYEKLGGARLPPAQVQGEVALPASEAASVALYVLDLLAARPLRLPPEAPWNEFVAMLEDDVRSGFHHPTWARRISEGLSASDDRLTAVLEALADEWVWYEANARSGRDFFALGIVVMVVAVVLPFAVRIGESAYALSMAGLLLAGTLAICLRGWRTANRLLEERRRDGGGPAEA